MARGINKVILVGNVGQDPEMRALPSGVAVANLRVATSESWKDRQTGEQREQTEWHSIVMFGRLAEVAGEYVRKGQQLYLEGRLRTRKWQDKAGVDRYSTEIVADDFQMLGRRDGWESGSRDNAQVATSRDAEDWGRTAPRNASAGDIPF